MLYGKDILELLMYSKPLIIIEGERSRQCNTIVRLTDEQQCFKNILEDSIHYNHMFVMWLNVWLRPKKCDLFLYTASVT